MVSDMVNPPDHPRLCGEHLNGEIRPIETLFSKTLYELKTPNGYKKYAISHEFPEYRDFRMPDEDVLKIWEKYRNRA